MPTLVREFSLQVSGFVPGRIWDRIVRKGFLKQAGCLIKGRSASDGSEVLLPYRLTEYGKEDDASQK